MDIFLKVETTGLENDDEVIRWTANTYKGNVVTTGKVELEDKLYHPAFKRGWEDVSKFNGITPEMVADKPSNTELKKDLTKFFDDLHKKYPSEPINVIMWDAKFTYEALAKTGFKLNKDINVVNLLEPMSIRIAYEEGEAWKDSPQMKNVQTAFSLYYSQNELLDGIKENPSKYLDVVKHIHTALKKDLAMDRDELMCRDSKRNLVYFSELQDDKRVNINPMKVATLYSEEVLAPCPSKLKQRNYDFWQKRKEALEQKYKDVDKLYSIRLEKERTLDKEKQLSFKVDSVKEYKDEKKGIVGFLIFVHDSDRSTSVFIPDKKMKELTGRFLLLPAEISDDDRKAEENRVLRLAAIVFLETEKDIFKGKNNSMALSEAGSFCLDKAVSTHTDSPAITIDVAEITEELHKPWAEVSKDLKRDIRAEGLEELVEIPSASEDKGVITVSPIVATKFFGKRWEEEKIIETVIEEQKEDASHPLVIRNGNLQGMDLSGMDLSNAVLTGTDLSGANLSDTNLTGANLTGAKMDKDTKVVNTNFTNAVIISLQSEGTDFRKAVALNRAITSVNRLNSVQRKIVDDLQKSR